MLVELPAPTDMLPYVSVAYDLWQAACWLLLVDHQSAEQNSLAGLPVLDSENQPACDPVEPLQPDDFAILYVERAIVLTNHYWHSLAQDLPMPGN